MLIALANVILEKVQSLLMTIASHFSGINVAFSYYIKQRFEFAVCLHISIATAIAMFYGNFTKIIKSLRLGYHYHSEIQGNSKCASILPANLKTKTPLLRYGHVFHRSHS